MPILVELACRNSTRVVRQIECCKKKHSQQALNLPIDITLRCALMNQAVILILAMVFSSVAIVSGTNIIICDNAPCESQINASLGKEFAISLEFDPSTGFEWWTKFDPNYLSLICSTFVTGNEMPGLVGVPGTELFTFNAKNAGDTEVIMLLLQSRENGTIAERKIFPINIMLEAVAPKQPTVLGSGINAEHTTIRKSSFRSSGGLGANTMFSDRPISTAVGVSSNYYLNESEMDTPSQAASRHEPVGYDLTPPGNPSL
jgi:predicted secreted protein